MGTLLGGAAWVIAGRREYPWARGGAAMGGFLGVQISMLLDMRAAKKKAASEEHETRWKIGSTYRLDRVCLWVVRLMISCWSMSLTSRSR